MGMLAAAVAQDAAGRGQATLATLPQSNEALVLSSQVEQALQVGDHRLAIELIGRIMDLPSNLVAAPASRTFYPVWRHAFLLYGQLSEQGVAQYRQLFDGEVQARLTDAARTGDLDVLRDLFHRHRVSAHWPRVGSELVARLLDRGRFGEAIEVLREMRWAGVADGARHDLQLGVALGKAGAWQAARALTARVAEAEPDSDTTRAIAAWIDGQQQTAGVEAEYLLEDRAVWRVQLDRPRGLLAPYEDLEVFNAIEALQRLPLVTPLPVGDLLLLRFEGRLRALDALTLTPIWDVPDIPPEGSFFDNAGPQQNIANPFRDPRAPRASALEISPETRLLLGNQFRHLLAADAERAYTIEALTLTASDDVLRTRSFMTTDALVFPNELVARDLTNGRVVWRTGETESKPLAGLEFQDRPLLFGQRLVVPARRGNRVNLLELDAATGELRREVPVVGPPIHFTREGGRFQTVADETTIYLTTGNGVVAAVGRDTLEWKWATIYPSTVAEHLGRLWWKPPVEPRESGIDRPVPADDLLVLAPIDSLDIFALDRFSGRERWRIPRQEFTHIVGAVSAGIVVGGNALACLDLANPGGPARWRSVPLEIVGRSVVRGDRIFVPTRQGVVVLDGATGKVLVDQLGPDMRVADTRVESFTVLPADDALYCLTSRRLIKYPAPRVTGQLAEAASDGPAAFRGVLGQAWLAALRGRLDEARDMLTELHCEVPAYERSRRALLLHVCLELAARTDEPDTRIDWLRQADALAESPAERARLGLQIGRSLEELGDWPRVFRHYCEQLDRTEPLAVDAAGEPAGSYQVAAWLLAAERIAALAPRMSEDDGAVRAFARRSSLTPEVQLRLIEALPAGAVRAELAARLLRSGLPPEIKQAYLEEDFQAADLPADQLVETLVRRWETCVALGDAEAAERALADLERVRPAGRAIAADEQRLRSIRLSAGKLTEGPAPFGAALYRLWRMPETELLLDGQGLGQAWWRWLPVRNFAQFEIQLINVARYESYPHRKTHDALVASTAAPPQREENQLAERPGWGDKRRAYWPLRRTRSLAVVPVQHGLVALGLGPERAGGKRLWQRRMTGWDTVPDGFARTTTVDPEGVCLRERDGRIVRLDWATGQVAWQRDFGKFDIQQMVRIGPRLLLRTDDMRVWSCRLRDGGDLRPLPLPESAGWLEVVAERLLVLSPRSVAAFGWNGEDYELRWARPTSGAFQLRPVDGRPWVLLGEIGSGRWDVLSVHSGEPALPRPLTPYQRVQAAAVAGDRLLVAGWVAGPDEAAHRPDPVEVAAFSLHDGRAVWREHFETHAAINVTQLCGHPDLIPLAILPEGADGEQVWPQLVLLSRSDGKLVGQQSMLGDYEQNVDAVCDLQVLVAGGRLLVQVDGNVLAYGSPDQEAP